MEREEECKNICNMVDQLIEKMIYFCIIKNFTVSMFWVWVKNMLMVLLMNYMKNVKIF